MEQHFPVKTDRLLLRPLVRADAQEFFAYRSLPEVGQFQSWQPAKMNEVQAFLAENESASLDTPDAWYQLAICLLDGLLIGDIGIHTLEHGQMEIGYTLSPMFQGMGYATEAVRAVVREAFTVWNKHRITASVDPDNHASVRLLERLGFRKEAHHSKSYWMRGRWADDCIYAMLQEDYARLNR